MTISNYYVREYLRLYREYEALSKLINKLEQMLEEA